MVAITCGTSSTIAPFTMSCFCSNIHVAFLFDSPHVYNDLPYHFIISTMCFLFSKYYESMAMPCS